MGIGKIKDRLKRSALPVVVLAFTFLIYGPLELCLSNRGSEEFWFSFTDILGPIVALAVGAVIAILALLVILPEKAYRIGLAIVIAGSMLMIPRGFGHGFKTLTDDVEFCYKVDNLYSRECDRGIRFDDPTIGVDWGEVKRELLSQKDTTTPLLDDSDCNFVYGNI